MLSAPPRSMQRKFTFYFLAAWLAFLLTKATQQLIRFFPSPDAELNGDAYWTYLPSARKLLDHPWAFLTTDPASYHVAPLGYIWPALWGADPVRIQVANCVLFLACVLLMWRAAIRLGGWIASVVAVALLTYHPDLTSYIPQVLTESIYLFGLMLFTTGAVEFVLGKTRPRLWLALAALGLTITLLSRPVLQIFAIAALFLGLGILIYSTQQRQRVSPLGDAIARLPSRPVCLALIAALALPAAVIVKNGLSFDLWSMGTGAGAGLYYGVSPFKMGLEPVYSGFNYDAGITPLTVAPETKGHPLSLEADRINARVAVGVVKGTSLPDNAAFFAQKLKAWLLYSTPELRLSHKLRSIRTFEWLAIGLAALVLIVSAIRRPIGTDVRLPGSTGMEQPRLAVLSVLMLGVFGMALQLTPVLYNTRYNAFFLEPWLMLLAGVSTAILLQRPVPPANSNRVPASRWLLWLAVKAIIVLVLAGIPSALTRYSLRHETWGMDPYRPGPVAVLLDRASMSPLRATQATSSNGTRWQLETNPATLNLPLHVAAPEALAPSQVMDAMWRLRFSVAPPAGKTPNTCRKAMLAFSKAYPAQDWYEPEPALFIELDGAMHTYAIHGNDQLRPAGTGELSITFSCPPGTIVTWAGAELLKSTLPEAARALIHQNQPIDPYLRRDPH